MGTKSIYIFVILVLGVINNNMAQNNVRNSTSKEIDKEILRCLYIQRLQNDSLDIYSVRENNMLLQIGKLSSKYSDFKYMQQDSILKTMSGAEFSQISNQMLAMTTGATRLNIFKNYPKGKITTTDRIPFDNYIYEEDIVTPKWILSKETAVICNYKCKKATTLFRGRNYTAWYTPDIPMNNGPWKFVGLPGLILKVVDDKGQVSFECIAIEKSRQGESIYMNDRSYIKTTKQKFNQTRKKYLDNPGAFVSGTDLVKDMPPIATKKRPYNPIELSE